MTATNHHVEIFPWNENFATGIEIIDEQHQRLVELLNVLARPEQVRKLRGAWVQDMARADWDRPRGHWIAARSAHYVLGSRRKGTMGATAAPFADAAAAHAFQAKYGGRVLAFAEIRPEMVDLSGGALHDTKM